VVVICIATAHTLPFPNWFDEIQDLNNAERLLELQEQGRGLGFKRNSGIIVIIIIIIIIIVTTTTIIINIILIILSLGIKNVL